MATKKDRVELARMTRDATVVVSTIVQEIRSTLNAIESTFVATRMVQHFKEIEGLAGRARKELEALEPSEKTQFTKRR